jgi:hypothetical protein
VARTNAEIKAVIAGARRAERVVPVVMRADLAAECQHLERQIRDLELEQSGPAASLSGNPAARELAERIEALRVEMRESIMEFTIRALPGRRSKNAKVPTWLQLKESCPPREGNAKDKENGVDMDAFNEALVRVSIVDPVLDEDDWGNLLEALSDAAFTEIVGHCYGVNQDDTDVPFSYAASRILKTSDSE